MIPHARMNTSHFITLLFLFFATVATARGDWPQWRGPERNGLADPSAKIPDSIPEDYSLTERWTSLEIPSDHYGGHGSVSVSNGNVYLSVVWHRDEPTETRKIDGDVLSTLGYRGTRSIPEETRKKMEEDRMSLSRRLRGAALDEWAKEWVEANIDEKTQLSLGSWIISRFKKGQAAIPLQVYDVLLSARSEVFEDQAAMEAWVDAQNFEPLIRDQIIKAVPATRKVADDTILCLDAETGATVWEFKVPGFPSGRASSSTPAIADGRVYAALSEHFFCVDAQTGEEIWRAPMTGKKGPASSPLVHGDHVFVQQNQLTAFHRSTGEEAWTSEEVTGANSSPAVWRDLILCNTTKALVAVDGATGETVWSVEGGGDGTPVVYGDHVVISSRQEAKNLVAYHLGEDGPKEIWSHSFLARRYGSTPIISGNNVYYLGSERHLCLDLASGEIQWERQAQSAISSPLLADGKLIVYENRGGFAKIIRATPEGYESIGRAKVGALYCASPAIVGSDLYLRTAKNVVSYRFE
ncbi:MAG: PQQ-binding-like beta-propeller repeat protein [Verrucomicrobiota bacterium]